MAKVKPFRAVRPTADKVHLVATRSYISYSKKELRLKLEQNPYSFLNVINPFYNKRNKPPKNSKTALKAIKEKFNQFVEENILQADEKPHYYIYTQQDEKNTYTGIIALAAVDDYLNNVIKKHEATLTKKEKRLKNYLNIVDINAEPVCITYEDNAIIDDIIAKCQKQTPVYQFTTPDKSKHWLWRMKDETEMYKLEAAFQEIPAMYIADGHHRAASSSRYAIDQRKKNKHYSGEENFNYFMAIFFSEQQIVIHDFNRVVKDLNGLSEEEFIAHLKLDFDVTLLFSAEKPQMPKHINMYIGKKWYSLVAKSHCFVEGNNAGNIDSNILSEKILSKQLGIADIRTDKRIQFISGIEGIEKLTKLVDSRKFAVAFALHPVSIEELKAIADNNEIMPPKTTWINPKLRSALTIYKL